jgi:hypothetical protein
VKTDVRTARPAERRTPAGQSSERSVEPASSAVLLPEFIGYPILSSVVSAMGVERVETGGVHLLVDRNSTKRPLVPSLQRLAGFDRRFDRFTPCNRRCTRVLRTRTVPGVGSWRAPSTGLESELGRIPGGRADYLPVRDSTSRGTRTDPCDDGLGSRSHGDHGSGVESDRNATLCAREGRSVDVTP